MTRTQHRTILPKPKRRTKDSPRLQMVRRPVESRRSVLPSRDWTTAVS